VQGELVAPQLHALPEVYCRPMLEQAEARLDRAAEAIAAADAMLITAGAGIGVDSGLPDFRGNEGFWRAYPPFRSLGLSFVDLANPDWFERDAALAWGFYGHRLELYRTTTPHAGFTTLARWAAAKPQGCFVFTSNVDGHFQKAGFDEERIAECHGSIHHLQCSTPCSDRIWDAAGVALEIDPATFRARSRLPLCPDCGSVARPNVLMFGDGCWVPHRSHGQHARLARWLDGCRGAALVVVELGAGTAVPTVRLTSERVAHGPGATLVRINVREPQAPPGHIGIAAGALEALSAIDRLMGA